MSLINPFELDSTLSDYQGAPIDTKSVGVGNFKGYDTPEPVALGGGKGQDSGSAFDKLLRGSKPESGKLTPGGRSLTIGELQNAPFSSYDPALQGKDEDMLSLNQSTWDKAANGLLKMGGTAISTAVSSTLGTINGLGEWARTGKFSSFYDNDFSHALDEQMKGMEAALPHYRTAREREGSWYEPANLFTANFLFDSVIKNLGFSLGAAVPALGIGKALNALKLSSKLFAAGEALSAVEAVEAAQVLPRIQQLGAIEGKLQSFIAGGKGLAGSALKNLGAEAVGGAEQAGSLVKGIASVLSSTGEASMEAFNNLNEFRTHLIEDYKSKHDGAVPSGADLDAINTNAQSVGNSSFLLNTLLLSGTEYVQLPKIFGSTFKGERNLLNATVQDAETGLWRSALPTSKLGKLARRSRNFGSLFFNEAEAFEEGAQFTIQKGTQDYYGKKYRGEDNDFFSSLGTGIKQTLTTDEGLENIFLGGFSGALMTSGFLSRAGIGKTGKIAERGWFGEGGERADNTTQFVAGMNKTNIKNYLREGVDQANRATTLQEEREAAIRNGDILESKDLEFDYSHNYLSHRIKWGRYDLVQQDIQDAREQAMTATGFLELQNQGKASQTDTQQTFAARLDNFEKHAKNVKDEYERVNNKYGNLVTPDGQKAYTPEVLDKMVYSASKVKDYDIRLKELARNIAAQGVDLTLADNFIRQSTSWKEGKVQDLTRDAAVANSATEIAANIDDNDLLNQDEKGDLKQQVSDYLDITAYRKSFIDDYNSMIKNPEKFKETPVKAQSPAQTSTVKTKGGDKNLVVGDKYFLSGIETNTKQGFVKKKYPVFTFVSQNEDGSITVKEDSTGKIKTVSAAELAKYSLGAMKDVAANKTAQFYFNNTDQIFERKFKGKKVQGVLRYNPKTNGLSFEYFEKGKKKTIPVINTDFSYELAKKAGYKEPLMTRTGRQLTEAETKAIETEKPVTTKYLRRYEMLQDMVSGVKERLEKTKKSLETKQKELADLENSYKNLATVSEEKTAKGNLRKVAKNALKTMQVLGETKAQLLDEIATLEADRDQLEIALPYFDDLFDNFSELPENLRELAPSLREDIDHIKEMIDHSNQAIEDGKSIVEKITGLLDRAYEEIKTYIGIVHKDAPSLEIGAYQDKLEKYLGEEGARQFVENGEGFTNAVKAIQADILAAEEELSIPQNKARLEEMQKTLGELKDAVKGFTNEMIAKQQLAAFFEDRIKQYEDEEAKRKDLENNKKVQEKYFNQQKSAASPTLNEKTGEFEPPKKDAANGFLSSTDPVWEATTKDDNFHRRHQSFLFNSTSSDPKVFSQKEIGGKKVAERLHIVAVTSTNAEGLGFDPNWIEEEYRLKEDKSNIGTAAIRYVYAVAEGEKLFYVDEHGNNLSEVGPKVSNESSSTEKRKQELGLENVKEILYPDQAIRNYHVIVKGKNFNFLAKFNKGRWDVYPEQPDGLFSPITPGGVNALYLDNEKSKGIVEKYLPKELIDLLEEADKQDNVDKQKQFDKGPIKEYIDLYRKEYLERSIPQEEEILNFYSSDQYPNKDSQKNIVLEQTAKIENYRKELSTLNNNEFAKLDTTKLVYTNAEDLTGKESDGSDSFTNKSDLEIKAIQQYMLNIRKGIFGSNAENTKTFEFQISRGHVYNPGASRNTNLFDSGLVQESDLDKNLVISVPTLPGKFPVGIPLLDWNGNTVYLNNRNFTRGEAENIYDIMVLAARDENISTEVFNYLRNILFFSTELGEGKSMKRNQVLFEKDGADIVNIVIGENKVSIPFIPVSTEDGNNLVDKKAEIVKALENMYHHVNANSLQQLKDKPGTPFLEKAVVDGEIKTVKEWPSYQHYLLSGANAPLTANVPIPQAGEVPIVGKYSVIALKDYDASQFKKEEKAVPKEKPKEEPKKETQSRDLDALTFTFEVIRKDGVVESIKTTSVTVKENIEINGVLFKKGENNINEKSLIQPAIAALEPTWLASVLEEESAKNQEAAANEEPVEDTEDPFDGVPDEFADPDAVNRAASEFYNKFQGDKSVEAAELRRMLPNVSIEMVDHLIKMSGGGVAWGSAQAGLTKLYEDAPFGTGYHEAFEQVFNWVLPPKNQKSLFAEFKTRKGTFTTFKGETKNYADATFGEAKEQMAEDFIEYKQSATIPAPTSKIVQFFKDLWNMIKEFFKMSPDNLATVFDKLNKGNYRQVPQRTGRNVEYRERNVEGEAISFVNTVLSGMTADMFAEKWRNDVSLIMDMEEKPGDATEALFTALKTRLTDYYENKTSNAGVAAYFKNIANTKTEAEKGAVITQYKEVLKAWERVKKQWPNYTEDLKSFLRVFDISFQVDDEGNLSIDAQIDDNPDDKNQLEYIEDTMSVNAKNSASKVVKLLMATISDSEFVKNTIMDSLSNRGSLTATRPIRDNAMAMKMLAPYAKLFNYILYNTANTPGIYNILDKLDNTSKNTSLSQNANVRSLLARIGYDKEKGFKGMSIPQIKLLLKLENALSKNKPLFVRQELNENGHTIFKLSNIYDRVSQLSESWINGLRSNKFSHVAGDNISFDKTILSADPFIFLDNLGIPIKKGTFSLAKEPELIKQIEAIKGVIQKFTETAQPLVVKNQSIGIDGRIKALAKFYVDNIEGESTESQHLNMANKVTANFVLPNFISHVLSDQNVAPTLAEYKALNPQYDDLYMGSSYFLNNVMYSNGQKNKTLNVTVVEGKNIYSDNRPTDKMNVGERMLYEFNNNLNGYYYILMPSDSKTEYALNTGSVVDPKFFGSDRATAYKEYTDKMYASFQNEAALVKDYKNRKFILALNELNEDKVEKGKDFRFFKYIVSKELQGKALKGTLTDADRTQFDKELAAYITEQAKSSLEEFRSWRLIEKDRREGSTKSELHGFDGDFIGKIFNATSTKPNLDENQILDLFKFREMNYVFSNIEMHKLFFNDPAQYKDELKRTKSFQSGREASHVDTVNDETGLNSAFNVELNKGLVPGDIGFTNFKNHLNSITIKELKLQSTSLDKLKALLGIKSSNYNSMEIADAQSWAHGSAYRQILYKSGGRFTAQQEELHQWLTAFERSDKAKLGKYTYSSEALRAADEALMATPIPSSDKHIMYILKPIVSGTRIVNGVAVQYLYKTSTAPLYYYFVKGRPLEKVLDAMTEKDVDFLAMASANKVGQTSDNVAQLYDATGEVSSEFKEVQSTPIDFKYFGIQVDTASQKEAQTQGSQLTKLALVDLMDNGVPVDFIRKQGKATKEEIQDAWDALPNKEEVSEVYRLVQKHTDDLIALAIKRSEAVMEKLGITEDQDGFSYKDKAIISKFILAEMERRELPENIKEGVSVSKDPSTGKNEFVNPLEANVNYPKIKQILWSVIEKGVTRPKVSGGPKVQMSVAGWGTIREVEINGKKAYVDDTLKYYGVDENGKTTPCEIMLPFHFGAELRAGLEERGKTFENEGAFQDHILEYLNKTPEGQALLKGIGFRIPTQAHNSVEYFIVKKFLPKQLGDMIVLPAEITAKAGSDFDVDKLNTYLKNYYIGTKGYPKLVKFKEIDSNNEQALTDYYEDNYLRDRREWELKNPSEKLMNKILGGSEEMDYVPSLEEFIAKYKGKPSSALNSMKALENEYFNTLEQLYALEDNRKSLLSPNDASQLSALSKKIQVATNNVDEKINPGHLINSTFMAKKRGTMLSAKGAVGISAVSSTNLAINQLNKIFASIPKKFAKRNIQIRFPHNRLNGQITLSSIGTQGGDNISAINSQVTDGSVDVAKEEWLPRMGFTDRALSTALFLNKIGVSINEIAYFLNQPIIKDMMKQREINNTISLYNRNLRKIPPFKIQNNLSVIYTGKEQWDYLKTKPNTYTLAAMEASIGKTVAQLTKEQRIAQVQMLDDYLAYEAMAGELFKVVQAYNYDTSRIGSPEAVYAKDLAEEIAQTSAVNMGNILTNSYLGTIRNSVRNLNTALKQLIGTQMSKAGTVIARMSYDIKKQYGIGNDKDLYVKYMGKAESAMLDYIIQNSATLKGQPMNSYIKTLFTSPVTPAHYIKQLKSEIFKDKSHPLRNNQFIKNLVPNIHPEAKTPSTLSIAEPAFDTFTSDSYTDQFRELLASAVTVSIPGQANSSRTMSQIMEMVVVAQIIQSGSQKRQGSFFDLIPNEVYSKYATPALRNISQDVDFFYDNGLFYRNNHLDNKLVPMMYADVESDNSESGFVYSMTKVKDKDIYFMDASKYRSFPYVKQMDRKTRVVKLFKRVDSEDNKGRKSPAVIMRTIDATDPFSKSRPTVAYQEVNILGGGRFVQEYPSHTLSSVLNPQVQELRDDTIIRDLESRKFKISYENLPNITEDGEEVLPLREKTVDSLDENGFEKFKDNTKKKDCN